MQVRILSIEGCGGTEETTKRVEETAQELGIPIECEHILIKTQEEARKYRHIGSPTVQVNGLDIEPDARVTNRFGLT